MTENDTHKPKRVRSPAYPSINLETAIERVKTIYGHEKRNSAPVAVVTSHCGSDAKSSAAMRLIAALKQFGLVVEEGSGEDRQVRLSDRALDIELAESQDSSDRLEAIEKAALAPKIHKKIWDHYEGKLPSDQTFRVHLIRKRDFNAAVVNMFIKQFRSTIKFAKLKKSDIIEDETGTEVESDDNSEEEGGLPATEKSVRHKRRRKQMPVGTKEDVYTLSAGDVVLQWPSHISPDESPDVDDWLDLMKRKMKRSVVEDDGVGNEPEEK